jgi:hypothetical protein
MENGTQSTGVQRRILFVTHCENVTQGERRSDSKNLPSSSLFAITVSYILPRDMADNQIFHHIWLYFTGNMADNQICHLCHHVTMMAKNI